MGSGKGRARRAQVRDQEAEFKVGDKVVLTELTARGRYLRTAFCRKYVPTTWYPTEAEQKNCRGTTCVVVEVQKYNDLETRYEEEALYKVELPMGRTYALMSEELQVFKPEPELTTIKADDLFPVVF